MAASTRRFTLTSAVYKDISEGYENCGFRLRYQSPRDNALRIVLGVALPSVDTGDYDLFDPPSTNSGERPVNFRELTTTDRVYARADRNQFDLTVYRK